MRKFDAIVIGSGQGGTPLAKKLAKAGLKTAIVEKRSIGGTCINDGCTPTKAMIASARMAHLMRTAKDLGIETGAFTVNLKAIIDRKNKIVESFRGSAERGLRTTENLTVLMGEAVFTGKKTIQVTSNDGPAETCIAESIFINTGTTTKVPKIAGINEVRYYTSTSLLDVEEIPRHLIIIGGGYIALEYGQMFRRFGSEVSMIIMDEQFLPKEDRDISSCLKNILTEEGIKIYVNARAEKVTSLANDDISVEISRNGDLMSLEGSHLLIATGRIPQTNNLHLHKTEVEMDEKGYIIVDEYLQTSEPGIYALGDVKGGPAFTHISYNDYIVLSKNILDKLKVSVKGRPVPYTMFTDPQLGRIGITEEEARNQELNFKAVTLPMDHVARGIETGETRGMMKAIVDTVTKQILGVAILGEAGGEVMSVLQMAMQGKISYEQLRENIFAHPLYAESINNLFMSLDK